MASFYTGEMRQVCERVMDVEVVVAVQKKNKK